MTAEQSRDQSARAPPAAKRASSREEGLSPRREPLGAKRASHRKQDLSPRRPLNEQEGSRRRRSARRWRNALHGAETRGLEPRKSSTSRTLTPDSRHTQRGLRVDCGRWKVDAGRTSGGIMLVIRQIACPERNTSRGLQLDPIRSTEHGPYTDSPR